MRSPEDLHQNYLDFKKQAYENLQQKGRSSTIWIGALEASPIVLGRDRATLMLAVYIGMRILDDIADGDMEPPEGFSPVDYLLRKQQVLRGKIDPEDDIDDIFTYALLLSEDLDIEIHEELDKFFDYFLFDAKRFKTWEIFSQEDLDEAYDACDIYATIVGALKLFGQDPRKHKRLMALGKAVRNFYNLRDFEEDIEVGFVNIPEEERNEHGISDGDLLNTNSTPVKSWFIEHANEGLDLLEEHNENLSENFNLWRGRFILWLLYERPARAYFNAVLDSDK